MNVTVVYNPASGNAKAMQHVRDAFAAHNIPPHYIAVTDKHLRRTVQSAAQGHGAIIVAAGGDGTVSAVAALVQGTAAKFGVIPLGTLNHFAKDATLPFKPGDAVKTILRHQTKRIDVAAVNGRVFINNASLGVYPDSLRKRKSLRRKLGNLPAAIISLGRVLIRPRRIRIQLTVDGKHIMRRTPFVFIGNNAYAFDRSGFTTRDKLDGGQLAVCIVKASGPFSIVRLFATRMFTKKRRTNDFEIYYTDACAITTRHKKTNVASDGEVTALHMPLHFKSLPKKLRLIVPA